MVTYVDDDEGEVARRCGYGGGFENLSLLLFSSQTTRDKASDQIYSSFPFFALLLSFVPSTFYNITTLTYFLASICPKLCITYSLLISYLQRPPICHYTFPHRHVYPMCQKMIKKNVKSDYYSLIYYRAGWDWMLVRACAFANF